MAENQSLTRDRIASYNKYVYDHRLIPGFYWDVAEIACANTSTKCEYDLLYARMCATCIRIAARTKYSTWDVAIAYRRLAARGYDFLAMADTDVLTRMNQMNDAITQKSDRVSDTPLIVKLIRKLFAARR